MRLDFQKKYIRTHIMYILRVHICVKYGVGQITHLICARLKYDLYDFFRGCFGAFSTRKEQEAGPKHPLKKSYRSYFRRAQIR